MRILRLIVASAFLGAAAGTPATDSIVLHWQPEERGNLPRGWRELTFPRIERHTHYTLVADGDGYVMKAAAERSASGLTHAMTADVSVLPWLHWRWKIERLLDRADISRKDGDDYPARIYVTFAYDPRRASLGQRIKYEAARLIYGEYPPHAGLNYVWDGKAALNTNVPNAFTDRVHMIVVDTGAAHLGEWVEHVRNIRDDYRASFKEDPPPISGIAIMTDTDNTGDHAVAYYGDIGLSAAP